jgi:hypothetical protein
MHGVQQAQERELSPPATIIFLQPENNHGTKIFEEGIRQGRARDEGTQRRDLEERPLGAEGHKPQAGDRDRPFGGEGGGCESPEEDLEARKDNQETDGEAVDDTPLYIFVMAGFDQLFDPAIPVFCPAMDGAWMPETSRANRPPNSPCDAALRIDAAAWPYVEASGAAHGRHSGASPRLGLSGSAEAHPSG